MAYPPHRWENRFPSHRRTRHNGDRGRFRQLHVVVCRYGINEHAELERRLAKRLQPQAGRTLPRIAEAHHNPVPLLHETLDDLDVERLIPGTDIALRVIASFQHGVVARLDGDVVGGLGIVKLQAAHIGGEAEHDLQAGGVVHPEAACGVGQRE